jgi:hypothetical protein
MSLDTTGIVVGAAVVAGAVVGAAAVVPGAVGGAVAALVAGCVVWVGASVPAVTTTLVVAASCDVTSRLQPIGTSARTTIPHARRLFIVTSTVDDRVTSRQRILVVPPPARRLPSSDATNGGAMEIFVSYARRDRQAVDLRLQDIRRARHDVWVDEELTGGQAWWEARSSHRSVARICS